MSTPQPDDLVLVTLVNNERDFARLRDEHWYRLPVLRAPRRGIGAPWLAFYQTKVFAEERWTITYYAAALAWEVMPRRALLPAELDHPRADQEYFRVSLGPVQRLPHPIPSRSWKRITFILTHWAQIERAWDVSDLFEANALERGLWKALEKLRAVRDDDEEEWID